MIYYIDGCIGRKRQERGKLVIMNFRGIAFFFKCLCYFLVFLLFVSYGIWCVSLHGMLTPRSKVGGEVLFPRFSLVV